MSTTLKRYGQPVTAATLIPARLDRLPWSRFHWRLVVGLGVTWALDGLEVTLMGAISAVLQRPDVLAFSSSEIGALGSAYLAGAVLGALVFGHLTDRFGRRKFFFICLGLYLCGVAATACAVNFTTFAAARFLTGAGIGGEYSAVNSAIDELIPARFRGRVDLMVNGSYWLGAALGAAATLLLLNPRFLPPDFGWRVGFGAGLSVGLVILYLRRYIPESPRWLVIHGQQNSAEATVAAIEHEVELESGAPLPAAQGDPLRLRIRHRFGLRVVATTILTRYRSRSLLGLTLMAAQAFIYNAILFTYAIVLTRYYGIAPDSAGIYLLPFAAANFLGPILLGHLFDTVGRRAMISATFAAAGLILVITGLLFWRAQLTALSQVAIWTAMFAFASPAGSAAYLTVSEIFPLEIRALAIALFYAAGTAVGGVVAPWFFGRLIESGARSQLLIGYLIAAALMLVAALVELLFGVAAENQSLENIAAPLSAVEE